MLSLLFWFVVIIFAFGLISWCLGGDFLESSRGCGGCLVNAVVDIIIAIIAGIIILVLLAKGIIS